MLVSCGRPFPGHRLRIVDQHGRELPERQVGEITLAGPSVMLRYYKQDELTAETLRNGWLHTGDLGYVSDGELFVCGRVKDIIIVNGRKYHPQDLDWGLQDLPGIRRGRIVAFAAPRQVDPTAWSSSPSRAGRWRRASSATRSDVASATCAGSRSTRSCWCAMGQWRARRAARRSAPKSKRDTNAANSSGAEGDHGGLGA